MICRHAVFWLVTGALALTGATAVADGKPMAVKKKANKGKKKPGDKPEEPKPRQPMVLARVDSGPEGFDHEVRWAKRSMKKVVGTIRGCYDVARETSPDLYGYLDVRVSLGKRGTVGLVHVSGEQATVKAVHDCVTTKVGKLRMRRIARKYRWLVFIFRPPEIIERGREISP